METPWKHVVIIVALLLACSGGAQGQALHAVTDPVTSDQSPAVIAAVENATNVTGFCEVTRGSILRLTYWFITKRGADSKTYISLHDNGTGATNFENFFATGRNVSEILLHSNLTIRVFDGSLDMANLSCGAGNDIAINGTFILRVISEFFFFFTGLIILLYMQ